MSSNPFRKKALEAIDTARAQSPAKSSLRSNSPLARDDDDDANNPRRPKPVKKVRVLSPPPLSPDSPEWPSAPPGASYSYNYSFASQIPENRQGDPFNGAASTDESDRDSATPPPPQPLPPPPVALKGGIGQTPPPPANPFSKTLQDLESSKELGSQQRNEGEALKAANAARQSLNVDAFRRLLMTGKASDAEPVRTQQDPSARADSATSSKPAATDGSRIGRGGDEESSNSPDSSDDDDYDDDYDDEGALVSKSRPGQQQAGKGKKAPPPPPSSRHGKSLRDGQDDTDVPKLDPPRDVNKPLPPSPIRRSIDDDSESPFDRESAGKVPEPEPTESESHSAPPVQPSSSSKKSAPAPPPRRGHPRSETKSQVPAILSANEQQQTPSKARTDETPVRTSTDEAPSRSDGPRLTGHAPAPPPPRRPYTAPRQTSHASSLGISSSQVPQTPSSPSTYQLESDHDRSTLLDSPVASPGYDASTTSNTKLSSPPPPPPARNPSVRRPPSVSSVEGISRRVSGEGRSARDSIPPPPPRRQRGSSPSSVDAPGRRSAEGAPRQSLRRAGGYEGDGQAAPEAGTSVDILADLDALQREVDALRGKFR